MIQDLPETKRFLSSGPLSSRTLTAVIGGESVPVGTSEIATSVDPATRDVLAEFALSSPETVDEAVCAAKEAFVEWGGWPGERRGEAIRKLAAAVDEHAGVLAQLESLDCGKLPARAEEEVRAAAETFRFFASVAAFEEDTRPIAAPAPYRADVRHFPWGPCGFITPWNFPLLLACWGIAPAIAAGNTAVLKPSEETPLSALYLAHIAAKIGFPKGVLNVVPGLGTVAGAALARHPDVARMGFVGSPKVGRDIAAACGGNLTPCKLELGGKGAAVILDDVDAQDVGAKLADWLVFNAGQVCCLASRWVIHRKVQDAFLETALARLKELRVGCPRNEDTQMGPLISETHRERVCDFVKRGIEQGAKPLLLGERIKPKGCEKGFFVTPTVLTGGPENVAAQTEIFGPVAYAIPFETEDEAVAVVNGTRYGLANSVWSADPVRAARLASRLVAGLNWINRHNELPLGIPYGGIKQSGMGGGVNAVQTYWDYRREMVVVE